jgi:hypothetical protein
MAWKCKTVGGISHKKAHKAHKEAAFFVPFVPFVPFVANSPFPSLYRSTGTLISSRVPFPTLDE